MREVVTNDRVAFAQFVDDLFTSDPELCMRVKSVSGYVNDEIRRRIERMLG